MNGELVGLEEVPPVLELRVSDPCQWPEPGEAGSGGMWESRERPFWLGREGTGVLGEGPKRISGDRQCVWREGKGGTRGNGGQGVGGGPKQQEPVVQEAVLIPGKRWWAAWGALRLHHEEVGQIRRSVSRRFSGQ